ncbi:MAG: DUF87 domain-containing protein [Candidatus Aminicenantes bacterium]|nr:DUF87 domain-containing protein [Candidatus Aminicenantes bacterium]
MSGRPVKICLGEVSCRNQTRKIYVKNDDLFRHQYILGATGSGKSTLIINEVLDSFRQGLCTWILDPHHTETLLMILLRRSIPRI